MNERQEGKVKFFNPNGDREGYGFLELDGGGKDAYFPEHELSSGMRLGEARIIKARHAPGNEPRVTCVVQDLPDGRRRAMYVRPAA